MAAPARRQVVVSFVAVKGGAGKSTLAIACACEWHRRGRRVLAIDVDKQQRSLAKWARLRSRLQVSGPPVIEQDLNLADDFSIADGFEIVVIDTPGKLGELPVMALGLSTLAIMPCGPNGIEVASMAETFEQVRQVRQLRRKLDARVLITRMQVGTTVARTAHKAYDEAPFEPLETQLHYRLDYGLAHDAGLGPTTYNPGSEAADEVSRLVDELDRLLAAPRLSLVRSTTRAR